MTSRQLQVDIATLLARIEQLENDLDVSKRIEGLALHVWDRVLKYDVPRLKTYLSRDIIIMMDDLK